MIPDDLQTFLEGLHGERLAHLRAFVGERHRQERGREIVLQDREFFGVARAIEGAERALVGRDRVGDPRAVGAGEVLDDDAEVHLRLGQLFRATAIDEGRDRRLQHGARALQRVGAGFRDRLQRGAHPRGDACAQQSLVLRAQRQRALVELDGGGEMRRRFRPLLQPHRDLHQHFRALDGRGGLVLGRRQRNANLVRESIADHVRPSRAEHTFVAAAYAGACFFLVCLI